MPPLPERIAVVSVKDLIEHLEPVVERAARRAVEEALPPRSRAPRGLVSVRGAGKEWAVSVSTVRRRIRAGLVDSVLVGNRRLIPPEEVERVKREGLG